MGERIIIDLREIMIGAIIGLLIIGGIYAALYGPNYIREISYPARENVKFITINGYAIRDWALRLNKDNINASHNGLFRSHMIRTPFTVKNLTLTSENNAQRIFGQFETQTETLDLFGKFEATVEEKKPTKITLDILSAKNTHGEYSLNRVGGKLELIEHKSTGNIEGNIQIGSMNYGGLPFGGSQMRIKGDMKSIGMELTTHISGHEGTTLKTLGKLQNGNLSNFDGLLKIDNPYDLAGTMRTMSMGTDVDFPLDFLKSFPAIDISFKENLPKKNSKEIQLDLKASSLGNNFKGLAALNLSNKNLKIGAQFKNIWPNNFPFGLKKTTGTITTQGILDLSFNQTNDEKLGPFFTKFTNLSLEKGDFKISNISANLKYDTAPPFAPQPLKVNASLITLDEQLRNFEAILKYNNNNNEDASIWDLENASAQWQDRQTNLNFKNNDNESMPVISLQQTYDNISQLSNLLRFDIEFAAPVQLSKTWRFKDNGYQSTPPSVKNTEAGLLILNPAIPELSNIYAEDLRILLDSDDRATIKISGKNPILYADKPVKIQTKIERFLAE